jgi:tetrahydromethanopterin S-methyltransferase subunit A
VSKNIGIKEALQVVREEVAKAVTAGKCHPCGCLQQTVEALSRTELGRAELAKDLEEARKVFVPKEYDCLGCRVCWPANAANVFAKAYPEESEELDLCPTEEPVERGGWPPLPGDYHVSRYRAPVALCTLNSDALAARVSERSPDGLAITGTLHTENLGIERLIKNVLGNPHLRFLILCGEDTQQAIGHLPGQSLESLFKGGMDERGRIRRARGKRPVLKNVRADQVEAFLEQVELVGLIGEQEEERIVETIAICASRDPGEFEGAPGDSGLETVWAGEPRRLVPDPAGFFVVYPDRRLRRLIMEHYTKDGVLDCMVEGKTPAALAAEVIERRLVTRLDHAAYLGRELARAERTMETGEPYIQDRAPGDRSAEPVEATSGCSRASGQGSK